MHGHHIGDNLGENELIALLEFNVAHNASHVSELSEIADRLKQVGRNEAADTLTQAIGRFSEGGELIKQALEGLK